jgi:hypothetical protein
VRVLLGPCIIYILRSDLDFPVFSSKWAMCLHLHLVFRTIGSLAEILGLGLAILIQHTTVDAAGTS